MAKREAGLNDVTKIREHSPRPDGFRAPPRDSLLAAPELVKYAGWGGGALASRASAWGLNFNGIHWQGMPVLGGTV